MDEINKKVKYIMEIKAVVSIVDNSILNKNALFFLIQGLLNKHFNSQNIFIISSNENRNTQLIEWLNKNKVNIIFYNWKKKDDPYEIKFLLSDLARKLLNHIDSFLYLDPDHVVFSLQQLESSYKEFLISSEYSYMEKKSKLIHFNTSFVYTNTNNWIEIEKSWQEEYENIKKKKELFRYWEEISFSNAARKNRYILKPCSVTLQSNYSKFGNNFSFFHYGGESNYSRDLKGCLFTENYSEVILNLEKLYKMTDSRIQKKVIKQMLSLTINL